MIMTIAKQLINRAFLLAVGLVLLTACGGPAPDVEQSAEVEKPAAATGEIRQSGELVSIDKEGNIAPFGMASKQPVPIADPTAGAVAVTTEANAALYGVHCSACHGQEATGVEGLGLNLVDSDLVASSSEAELAAFLKEGRLPSSPDSVTGVPMPSFAWMPDSDMAEITAYLKTL